MGSTEEIVGRWLRGKRDQIILATKAGGPMGPAHWQKGGSRKHLLDAIDGSLRRLGTDYVDIYQLHFDDSDTPLDETLATLDAIVTAGQTNRRVDVPPIGWLAADRRSASPVHGGSNRRDDIFHREPEDLWRLRPPQIGARHGLANGAALDALYRVGQFAAEHSAMRPRGGRGAKRSPTSTTNAIGMPGHSTRSIG